MLFVFWFLWPLRLVWLLVCFLYKEVYLPIFKIDVLLITRLWRLVGRCARKLVNHTSWVAVATPTDRPKSVRNCCLIEHFCGVVNVVTLPFWHFCWCRGFSHRTDSNLFLFVFGLVSCETWPVLSRSERLTCPLYRQTEDICICIYVFKRVFNVWHMLKKVYQCNCILNNLRENKED